MLLVKSKQVRSGPLYNKEILYPKGCIVPRGPAGADVLSICRIPIDGGTLFKVNIFGKIGSPNQYVELTYELLNAVEGDKFEITLHSPGGSVATGFMLINAMQACKAEITTIAVGEVGSVAAVIWSFGHKLIVNDWAVLTYHMSSHNDAGKSVEIVERATDVIKFISHILTQICEKGLITEEEMCKLVKQKADVHIYGCDMKTRVLAYMNNNVKQEPEEVPVVKDELATAPESKEEVPDEA